MSLYEKYYNTFALGDNALLKEVKEDYQKLANKYHPDKNGNQEKIMDINFAYIYLISNVDFSSIDENSNQKINGDFYSSNDAHQKDIDDFNSDFTKI